jgi:Fanconi anemia group M protein
MFSSPQCISNDLKNNLYNLEEVSLLIEDECHRCLKNYAYTHVVEKYKEHAKNPRVLGLTASPGADKKTIKQIAKNLGIEAIEVRTRESDDVSPYIQKLKFDIIKLDFPEELKEIKALLKELNDKKVEELKNRKLLFAPATKKNILMLQKKIMTMISTGNRNFNVLAGASACAQTIKLQYCLELLETQTLSSLQRYMLDIFDQAKQNKSKAVKQIIKQPKFNQAYIKTTELIARKIENPN